ncbi:MAG: hypothetical protein ACQER9_02055 [Nanobdellota archaeon]
MEKEPIVFIAFGGTGDLTKRKLVPAFAELVEKGKISSKSTFIGIGRSNYNNTTYKKMLLDFQKDDNVIKNFSKIKIKYIRADVRDENSAKKIKDKVQKYEISSASSNKKCDRIIYLAVSYKIFPDIINTIKASKLDKNIKGFNRIAFEKPFGKDLKSYRNLEKSIKSTFNENDIYRIDHYLGKETVKNITILKDANPILDSILNNNYVKDIQIYSDEKDGVYDRLEYYNDSGAIKDMIQNHLLQVVSLVLADKSDFKPVKLHKNKVDVLKNLKLKKTRYNTLGQYKNYKEETLQKGINYKKTETFANLVLECINKRWKGVPITLRTGKKLNKKEGKVIIRFKGNYKISQNKLEIDIQPKQDASFYFNIYKLGKEKIENVKFNFCHECYFGPNTSDGYSRIINEIIQGNKTLFSVKKEQEIAWKITEDIEKNKHNFRFIYYKKDSDPQKIIEKK